MKFDHKLMLLDVDIALLVIFLLSFILYMYTDIFI